MTHRPPPLKRWLIALVRWFDAEAATDQLATGDSARKIDGLRTLPFVLIHAACLCVIWVGWSPTAVGVAIALYALRMFAITGFYHRYFSHRTFQTSRPAQFVFAILGASAVQRGPIWWSAHHRHHHSHADQEADVHSPLRHGLLWSHMGWFLSQANFATRTALAKDWMKFPELRYLDRYDIAVPALLALALYGLGFALEQLAPSLATNGAQLLVWGFVISTVVLYHVTFTVNSLCHVWGRRRYNTRDHSRNNAWLAMLTFGEGWHNNHHHYPRSARQGFFWWELDLTYYLLKLLCWLGIIWDLQPIPAGIISFRRLDKVAASQPSRDWTP
jgi:stearoyl-CoA desaturase (delta-9 desaturase)